MLLFVKTTELRQKFLALDKVASRLSCTITKLLATYIQRSHAYGGKGLSEPGNENLRKTRMLKLPVVNEIVLSADGSHASTVAICPQISPRSRIEANNWNKSAGPW